MTHTSLPGPQCVPAPKRKKFPPHLKRSLTVQAGCTLIALVAAVVAGNPPTIGLNVGLFLPLALLVLTLKTRQTSVWHGARHGAGVGIMLVIAFTVLTLRDTWRHTLLGSAGLLLLLDYWRALHHPTTQTYFDVCCRPFRWSQIFRRTHVVRSFLVGLLVLTGSGSVTADDPPETLEECLERIPDAYTVPRDRVTKTLERYRLKAEKVKATAVADLQRRLQVAVQQAGPTSHQALAIKATYDWMMFRQAPPNHAAALPWIVTYCESIMRAQLSAWKQLTILNKLLVKDGHIEEATMLEAAFRRLETPRLISQNLISGRTFKGYRTTTDGKKLISILVQLNQGPESPVAGSIERDFMYRNHPVYNIQGQIDGLQVILQTGSVKSFGNKGEHAWTYTGYVIGQSIVGRFAGRDKKGKRKGGLFHIRSGR